MDEGSLQFAAAFRVCLRAFVDARTALSRASLGSLLENSQVYMGSDESPCLPSSIENVVKKQEYMPLFASWTGLFALALLLILEAEPSQSGAPLLKCSSLK